MTELTKHGRTFMGIPVEAEDYHRGRNAVEQRPIEELYDQFKLAFSLGVKAVRWTQYTPFFNDGEPCYFNVHDPFITKNDVVAEKWLAGYRVIEGFDAAEAYPDGTKSYYDLWDYEHYSYGDHPDGDLLSEQIPGIADGCYELGLLEAFGDHAEVIVTPNRVVTFDYDHD